MLLGFEVLILLNEVHFLLLFHEHVFVPLMQRSGVGELDVLAKLLFGWLWSQFFTEGGKLLLQDVMSSTA